MHFCCSCVTEAFSRRTVAVWESDLTCSSRRRYVSKYYLCHRDMPWARTQQPQKTGLVLGSTMLLNEELRPTCCQDIFMLFMWVITLQYISRIAFLIAKVIKRKKKCPNKRAKEHMNLSRGPRGNTDCTSWAVMPNYMHLQHKYFQTSPPGASSAEWHNVGIKDSSDRSQQTREAKRKQCN